MTVTNRRHVVYKGSNPLVFYLGEIKGKVRLFMVSGPSGYGKSTVAKLVRDILNIPLASSVTTRKMRTG